MGFPVIRIHGDEGQHIDGRLEDIKFSISADVMKAVSWITALHILSEGLSKTVGTSFVRVARGAPFICPHKDTVVIFAILKESLFFRKIGNHITVNVAVFHQVSKDAPHIGIRLGQFKWFLKRFLPSSSRRVYCTLLTSQERFDCVRVTVMIKPPDKTDRISALAAVVIEPFTATDGHAVISIEPLIPARRKEFFSSLAEELFQIHFSCSLFLLIGEMNILSHSTSFPLHRWPILPSLLLMIISLMPKG